MVAAIEDPNPQVAGKGIEMLRQAGIPVDCGVCRDEAYESNIGFFTRMKTGKPWVRLKTAVTLDGRTALFNGASLGSRVKRLDVAAAFGGRAHRGFSPALVRFLRTILR